MLRLIPRHGLAERNADRAIGHPVSRTEGVRYPSGLPGNCQTVSSGASATSAALMARDILA